jgi:hypothetical protein
MKDTKMVQDNNAFVRKEQARMKEHMGNRPVAPKEMHRFDAYMSNDGAGVKEFARKICKGLDDAFPLK